MSAPTIPCELPPGSEVTTSGSPISITEMSQGRQAVVGCLEVNRGHRGSRVARVRGQEIVQDRQTERKEESESESERVINV